MIPVATQILLASRETPRLIPSGEFLPPLFVCFTTIQADHFQPLIFFQESFNDPMQKMKPLRPSNDLYLYPVLEHKHRTHTPDTTLSPIIPSQWISAPSTRQISDTVLLFYQKNMANQSGGSGGGTHSCYYQQDKFHTWKFQDHCQVCPTANQFLPNIDCIMRPSSFPLSFSPTNYHTSARLKKTQSTQLKNNYSLFDFVMT